MKFLRGAKMKLRPELNQFNYWVHIVLIAFVVLAILKYVFNIDMLNFEYIWKFSIAIVSGDILAHTLLNLN